MNRNDSRINDLLNDKKELSNEESTMVDSIISVLNSNSREKTSQEKMPQISNEEKELLMKQRQYHEQQQRQRQMQQQQQIQQQQMQQQHIQNQQLQQQKQMAQMYSKMNGENKEDDPSLSMVDKIKAHFTKSIDVMIVFILTIIFNINTFSEFLKFKSVPLLFNEQLGASTSCCIILKGIILAFVYAVIKYLIK